MNKILKHTCLLFAAAAVALFSGCSKDDETEQPLEVNYNNIAGIWQLTEWNGQALPSSTYFYMQIERRDHKFKIWQNMDSMLTRYITGTYTIETDAYLGYVISGEYDYGAGSWKNDYIVTNLMPSGKMTWTVKDNSGDVSVYTRCDSVPETVLSQADGKVTIE